MTKLKKDTQVSWREVFNKIAPFVAIPVVLVLWQLFAVTHHELFPTPQETWMRLLKMSESQISKATVWGHTWVSMRRVLIAMGFAIVLGIPFGFAIGTCKWFDAVFGSIFEMLRPIPIIAWMPLIIIWMGIDEKSIVLMIFIAAFIPVVMNTRAGVRMIDSIYLDVGKIFSANTYQRFMEILIPGSFAVIFTGIRLALSSAWIVMLAGEMVAARQGLGFLIIRGMSSGDLPLILVSMITIGIVGALMAMLLQKVERLVCKWER